VSPGKSLLQLLAPVCEPEHKQARERNVISILESFGDASIKLTSLDDFLTPKRSPWW
jgi:hypothetical protein